MGKEAIIISIFVVYLIWNILNEVAVNLFWNTEDKKYIKEWHRYDAIFRMILFPLVIFGMLGFKMVAFKLIIIMAILYRPLFNLGFNYWRNRETFKSLTFKQKINVLLYLSEYSVIDKFLIKINNWLYGIIVRISSWIAKITKDKVIIRHNVRFQYFNLVLIVIELGIVILVIVWL